jgi:hypothetical protein
MMTTIFRQYCLILISTLGSRAKLSNGTNDRVEPDRCVDQLAAASDRHYGAHDWWLDSLMIVEASLSSREPLGR